MYENIRSMLKAMAPFEEGELDDAMGFFSSSIISKNEYFSKEGKISDRIGFVQSGILRSYYTINGRETTSFFLQPGSIAVAMLSFIEMKPAVENIQAISDSELIVINRKDILSLYEENWKWQQVGRLNLEQYYIEMERRVISFQSQTARERYRDFIKTHPEIIRSVPLHLVASYIGVSPETLSRLRKDISLNSTSGRTASTKF